MTRKNRKRKVEHLESVTQQRDEDLAKWCDTHDLAPDGRPLPAMELARRALLRQLKDEVQQAQRPKCSTPFYRLPYARDI